MTPHGSVVRGIRRGARIWGTAAALFWGAFFLEHVAWFNPGAGTPPLRVWLLQGANSIMVAALLGAWRYERAGGTMALLASVVFFAAVAGPRFPLFLSSQRHQPSRSSIAACDQVSSDRVRFRSR